MRTLNLGILAHVDAGKTTLTEALLHRAGVLDAPGSVDTGTTVTDSLALERRRGITIKTAVASFPLGEHLTVNVIDTPGHPDFIAEVERTLAVLDGAVLVLSAVEGVQPQTRILFRALRRVGVPTLMYVNKIDRGGADPDRVLAAIRGRLTADAVAMGSVAGAGTRAARFLAAAPDDPSFRERESVALAEHDEGVLAAYVDHGPLPARRLSAALATQTRAGRLHPVYAGSAVTGAGVPELVAAIATLLPPAPPEVSGPVSGRVFKVERGPAGEKLALVRLFAGSLEVRERVDLPGDRAAKASGFAVHRDGGWVRADRLTADQVGRVLGWRDARVGDGFGPGTRAAARHFPPPTLEAAIRAVDETRGPALRSAVADLTDQDPLIAARQDDDGDLVVALYGRVQQEVIAATLAEEYGVEVAFADAAVVHVERPRRAGSALIRLNTPENPYQATIGLRIESAAPGSGVSFAVAAPAVDMPLYLFKSVEGFAGAIEGHVRRTLLRGPHGWAVTDCLVTLTECAYSTADGPPSRRGPTSNANDYRQVTPRVVRAALAQAGTAVCEPLVRICVEAPTLEAPRVVRLLGRWGAELLAQAGTGELSTVEARLPATRVHDLQRQLPDLTGGEGTLEFHADGYAPVRGRPAPRRAHA